MKRICFLLMIAFAFMATNPAGAQTAKKVKSVSGKADAMMDQGKYYDAIQIYKKQFDKQKKSPMKAQAAYKAGECFRTISDWKNAEEWYGKAAKANAKDPNAVLRYADALKSNGKYDEAIAEYQKLKSKPGSVSMALIDFNTARVYEAMGKKQEAIDLYFSIANNKDYRSIGLGTNCVNRLTVLAPEKVDQLPAAEQTNPFASLGGLGGMSIR